MGRLIRIEPLTKLEGHGKVTIILGDTGEVESCHFHVTEFRGFEKFCEGRMLWDMPVITTRVCGICPVSHHLASVKAIEDLLGIKPPPVAEKLRELMHMGQIIHSHSLHLFFLAAPDFIVGPDADPQKRDIFGIIEKEPELVRKAIQLRKFGQDVIDAVGGRAIHPVTAIPGGMSRPFSHEARYNLLKEVSKIEALALWAVDLARRLTETYIRDGSSLGDLPTMHLGTVRGGALELYNGSLRLLNGDGQMIEEFDPSKYLDFIGEHVEPHSYLKFPYYKTKGWPEGIYRVGPLARLNVSERITTPRASEYLRDFKAINNGRPLNENLYYHYARAIEILYAVERTMQLLEDDEIVDRECRVKIDRRGGEGIGVLEAPRGTLIHHYWADDDGRVLKANLIVATAHNNGAIDRSVQTVARGLIRGGKVEEGLLNRIEMAIRCYDPCLSCSTHAVGEMPLEVVIEDRDGKILHHLMR